MHASSVTPTYTEDDVLEAQHHCSKVCGSLTAKRVLKKLGYDFAYEVPPSRRWLAISMLTLEAKRADEGKSKSKTTFPYTKPCSVRLVINDAALREMDAVGKRLHNSMNRSIRAEGYYSRAERIYAKLAGAGTDPAAIAAWRHLAARYFRIAKPIFAGRKYHDGGHVKSSVQMLKPGEVPSILSRGGCC